MAGDELLFRDSKSAGIGNVGEFSVENMQNDYLIWEISNPSVPANIPF